MPSKNGPTTKHVALVGVTGAGKSTLVNVLSGLECARVTNDVKPCTTQPDRYDIEQGGVKYSLWDTRGLNEASEKGATGSVSRFLRFFTTLPDADRELRDFLRGKDPKISLVLFCIEAEKIGVDAQWKNYDKIYVKFCKKKVKVAVVVTRMDWNVMNTNWKGVCGDKARDAVGDVPDARMIEAVPTFDELEDTRGCRSRILNLVSQFS